MIENDGKIDRVDLDKEELLRRLDEAEDTLNAIREGGVDALLIGDQVFRLESADAASNRFRGEVLAQVSDIVLAVDHEFRITYLNPAAEQKYGVRSTDFLGRKLAELYQVEWSGSAKQDGSLETLTRDGHWKGEVVHIKKDGTRFFADVMVSRFEQDALPPGYIAVVRDISDRKKIELELKEANEQLEARVEKRTSELRQTNESLLKEIDARTKSEAQRTHLLQRVVTTQEDERRRIARDIHDQLGQRVTALRLQIAAITEAADADGAIRQNLKNLESTASKMDAEVSFLAWGLRPAALDDIGLAEAAAAFIEDWSANCRIPASLNSRGFRGRRLDPAVETHLYRIMQESLNNVAKHAAAKNVSVLLEWKDGEVALIIEDDGTGVLANGKDADDRPGLGLSGMRERATLAGGTFEIEAVEGHGTTVYVRVPAEPDVQSTSEGVH